MSYAGLLSFIYAEMDPQDSRVKAVKEWLSKHYTIDENPGMGPQGLFYYYHDGQGIVSFRHHYDEESKRYSKGLAEGAFFAPSKSSIERRILE